MSNKNLFIAIGVVVLFGAYSFTVKYQGYDSHSLAYSAGDHFASFTLNTVDGREVSLDSVLAEKKYVWINFWATWCGPCRREMPMMANLYKQYRYTGLEILAVSVGEEKSTVEEYAVENELPFPILLDSDGSLAKKLNVFGLPTSFLVDSTGTVEQVITGYSEAWNFILKDKLGIIDE